VVRLISLGLATYRLASLISREAGPFDMFVHFRSWAGVYDIGPDKKPETMLGRMIECPYCTGVWVAIFLSLLPQRWRFSKWLITVLSVAGIQMYLQDRTGELA
jgi:hypothetical protein